MTRKQALHKALKVMSMHNDDQEIQEACVKIEELIEEMPIVHWSEKSIMDTLDQFVADNNRPPTSSDLRKSGMPPHPVIENTFKICAGEFLSTFYPRSSNLARYCHKSKEEWKEYFVSRFAELDNQTMDEYDKTRSPESPLWSTIANMHGIKGWNNWLKFCEIVPTKRKVAPVDTKRPTLQILAIHPLLGTNTLEYEP